MVERGELARDMKGSLYVVLAVSIRPMCSVEPASAAISVIGSKRTAFAVRDSAAGDSE